MSSPAPDRAYLRPHEFAQVVGVHVNTVRSWIHAGALPATKVGHSWLIPADALERAGAGGAS